jgi:hypothetical protein
MQNGVMPPCTKKNRIMVRRIETANLFSVTRSDETIKKATHFNVFQKKILRSQKKDQGSYCWGARNDIWNKDGMFVTIID